MLLLADAGHRLVVAPCLQTFVRRQALPALLNRALGIILADPDAYLRLFLGDDGYIARAARFDYPKPNEEDAAFPPEFFSLVDFENYCAVAFPTRVALQHVPATALHLLSRRFREGMRIE